MTVYTQPMTTHLLVPHPMLSSESSNCSRDIVGQTQKVARHPQYREAKVKNTTNSGAAHSPVEEKRGVTEVTLVVQVRKSCSGFRSSWCDPSSNLRTWPFKVTNCSRYHSTMSLAQYCRPRLSDCFLGAISPFSSHPLWLLCVLGNWASIGYFLWPLRVYRFGLRNNWKWWSVMSQTYVLVSDVLLPIKTSVNG